jgi:phage terminase small subunit
MVESIEETGDSLTPRQIRFVQHYLISLNATEAYHAVYGVGLKSAAAHGSRLVSNGKIAAAIAEAQRPIAVAAALTVESHLQRLAELAQLAVAARQFNAAITAETNRGKVAGLYIERTEDVTGLSKEQRRERLLKLVG